MGRINGFRPPISRSASACRGFVSSILGARHSVPIAAVLSAQYATLSVLVGVTVLRERMAPAQVIGLVLTIAGVAILSLVG